MAFNPLLAAGGALVVGGPAADDAAASGNPVPVGGKYNATLPTYTDGDRTQLQTTSKGGLQVTLVAVDGTQNNSFNPSADARATSVSGFFFNSLGYTFNGSTLDRARSVLNATDSTGTGIPATGLVAQFDNTSPTTVTENQFGNVRMSANGVLYVGPAPMTYTDRSSTIATGSTAQALMAANINRRGWRIQNLSTTTNLYINDVGGTAVVTATGSSFTLLPGAYYESADSGASSAAISINGTLTSQAFAAAEW